ncbi:MAG: hypothetical protein QXN87_02245 [Candidatus Bathyarchaeia archaeon]
MVKKIAVYGSYEAWVPVYQRYWKHRRDCITQRYWKKTKRMKKVAGKGRYEFYGKGKELYRAVVLAHKYMPKDFITVSAEKFIERPERYGFEGEWVEKEVESL